VANCESFWKLPISLEHDLNPVGFVLISTQFNGDTICRSIRP
jgi:hypothetical protein